MDEHRSQKSIFQQLKANGHDSHHVKRSSSVLSRSQSPSPAPSEPYQGTSPVVVGVCAMDIKARSKVRLIITVSMPQRLTALFRPCEKSSLASLLEVAEISR